MHERRTASQETWELDEAFGAGEQVGEEGEQTASSPAIRTSLVRL